MRTESLRKFMAEIAADCGTAKCLEVTSEICDIIYASMIVDGSNMSNETEVRHRFNICAKLARELRHDLKWSLERIVDTLPIALRQCLDNGGFSPDEARGSWIQSVPQAPVEGKIWMP